MEDIVATVFAFDPPMHHTINLRLHTVHCAQILYHIALLYLKSSGWLLFK